MHDHLASISKTFSHKMIIYALFYFFSLSTEARWARWEEAETVVLLDQVEMQIAEDGKIDALYTSIIEIKKESARKEFGIYQFTYNSRAQEITIEEAKTINGDETINVDPLYIEDKPKASLPIGFDEFRQVMIAFPQVAVGSKLVTKIRYRDLELPFEKYHFRSFPFGMGEANQNKQVRIRSKRKIHFAVNDPRNELSVKETKEGESYLLEVSNRKPLYFKIEEEKNALFPRRHVPWLDISTHDTIDSPLKLFIEEYEKILSAPLPEFFKKIRDIAAKEKSFIAQANSITSQLQMLTHYLGDWRPRRGGHIPRQLAEIAATRFGDCKDFSVAVVAILRSLGFHAHVALVYRDDLYRSRPTSLPSLSKDYNHAIVHVSFEGKNFWIDPTNSVSFAQGIFPDIEGRPGLVLRSAPPWLLEIPNARAEDRVFRFKETFDISDSTIHFDSHFFSGGSAAITFTGLGLSKSSAQTDFEVLEFIVEPNDILIAKFEPYDLKERIVRDLDFKAKIVMKNTLTKTPAGKAVRLKQPRMVSDLLAKTDNRVSDLDLRSNRVYEQLSIFQNHQLVGNKKMDCKIRTKWLDADRKISVDANKIFVSDKMTLKQSLYPAETLRSVEFSAFQRKIEDCFDDVALVLKKK